MTSQPEPQWSWPGSAGSSEPPIARGGVSAPVAQAPRSGQSGRGGAHGRRVAVFVLVLTVGLGGLAAAAVGIAHQLLPRRFTVAQQRQITNWEMERRWRALEAGKIFPVTVPYTVSGAALNGSASLTLQARRLGISPAEGCSQAVSAAAAEVLDRGGCETVLRATYVDSSGSMVATIAVAVLPAGAASKSVAAGVSSTTDGAGGWVQTFPVPGTPAAGFGDQERQLSDVAAAGPYVILSTAGFTDDRLDQVKADDYVRAEMNSLATGLVKSARLVLGRQPPPPVCPGAPGC